MMELDASRAFSNGKAEGHGIHLNDPLLRLVYVKLTPGECFFGAFIIGITFLLLSWLVQLFCIPEISTPGNPKSRLLLTEACLRGDGYFSLHSFNWVFGLCVAWPLIVYFLSHFYRSIPESLNQLDQTGRVKGLENGLTGWTGTLLANLSRPVWTGVFGSIALGVDLYTLGYHSYDSWVLSPFFKFHWGLLGLGQVIFVIAILVWQAFMIYIGVSFLTFFFFFSWQVGSMATFDGKRPRLEPEPNDPLRRFGFKHVGKFLEPVIYATFTLLVYHIVFLLAAIQKPIWGITPGLIIQSVIYLTIGYILVLILRLRRHVLHFRDKYEDQLADKIVTHSVNHNREELEKELRLLAEQSSWVTNPLGRGIITLGSPGTLVVLFSQPKIQEVWKYFYGLVFAG